MRGDLSSGVRGLFWQGALTNRSALKSTPFDYLSTKSCLPMRDGGGGQGEVTNRELAGRAC